MIACQRLSQLLPGLLTPLVTTAGPDHFIKVLAIASQLPKCELEPCGAWPPLLDIQQDLLKQTPGERAKALFAPDGMIGLPLFGILELVKLQPESVFFVRYEDLVSQPAMMMNMIYSFLGEESFEHDFSLVENTATDLDALYLNKFPHDGSGPVESRDRGFSDVVSVQTSNNLAQGFRWFFERFGYGARM